MKPAPKLQAFILKLAATHSVDLNQTGAYLRLELASGAPWARLVIENIGAYRINMACQLYLYHDWVSDPELVLWIDEYGAWTPIEVNQVQGGWCCYAEVDPNGDLEVTFDPPGQAGLADFTEEEVVPNLLEQEWFTQEVSVTTQRPAYSQEELLARGYIAANPWLLTVDEEAGDVPF